LKVKVNKDIRAPQLRVITQNGDQLGILSFAEALQRAQAEGLDLVEIVPTANPPVCKIINYGKFRYDQTKREKESKKSQHQVKVKELKFSPNISEHDLDVKIGQARDFLSKGHKVKVSCVFRGREMAHPEIGQKQLERVVDLLKEVAQCETPTKMFGRMLTMVLAPGIKKKK
jgi:translation initiation factor IF-3